MMLQALIAYAERENLGEADFESVGVRWLIPLDERGRLAGGPIPLFDNSDDKKPKPKRMLRPKSDPDFVSHGRSYFLCDSLERSLVFVEEASKREKRKINQCYFIGLLDAAANDCQGEAEPLRLLAAFLRDGTQLEAVHAQLVTSKAKASENVTFSVAGHNLIESRELKEWWRRRSKRERDQQKSETAVCLASGKYGPVCRTTGFIKLLGEDTKLISFNKECPAFESFGLSQAANAPIALDSEVNFRAALNALIEKSRQQRLVFNNTVHLHWTRKPLDYDPIDILANADEKAVSSLLKSVHTGQEPADFDDNAYYAMSLSGNGARVVVRDWLEMSVPEVRGHIARWFENLAIITPDGAGVKRDFKFFALLFGMVRKELDELSPQISTQLLYSALRGTPIPQSALAAALKRQQIEPRGEDGMRNAVVLARIALIKACLIRSPISQNQNEQPKVNCMSETLNCESVDPAYLCGRLFAVFDRLQYLAQGSVNAGVVDRYYASACVTPALVMGRLFRNAQFHLAKTHEDSAVNASKDFEAIATALGNEFPVTLDLEGQGRFGLGYYHQKAEFRRRRQGVDDSSTTAAK